MAEHVSLVANKPATQTETSASECLTLKTSERLGPKTTHDGFVITSYAIINPRKVDIDIHDIAFAVAQVIGAATEVIF